MCVINRDQKLCNLPKRSYFEDLELRSPLFLNCVAEKAKGQPDNKQSILKTIGFCDTYESKEHREITNQIERLNNEWTSPMLPQKN